MKKKAKKAKKVKKKRKAKTTKKKIVKRYNIRDENGWFIKREEAAKPVSERAPKKRRPIFRDRFGNFAKQENSVVWKNSRDLLLGLYAGIKQPLQEAHDEAPYGVPPEAILDLFATLSDDKGRLLLVTFYYMPTYANADGPKIAESESFIPQYCVYIGGGLDLAKQVSAWIHESYIIGSIETVLLKDDSFKPAHWHPIWSDQFVDTVDGPMAGSGHRNDRPKKKSSMVRAPKIEKKRDRSREKKSRDITGKKKNKGDVVNQRKRRLERQKAAKAK